MKYKKNFSWLKYNNSQLLYYQIYSLNHYIR